jgi:hypothetical protein
MLKSYKLNSRVAPRRLLAASLLLPLTIIIADAQQTSGTGARPTRRRRSTEITLPLPTSQRRGSEA